MLCGISIKKTKTRFISFARLGIYGMWYMANYMH